MARFTCAAWVLMMATAGCLGQPDLPVDPPDPDPNPVPFAFSEPSLLTTQGGGFEPSIVASPDGMLVATAAPTARPNSGDRLASFLWYSHDQGQTWHDFSSDAGQHGRMPGFEGDIAVDAEGRTYFVDIYLADTALHRWSPGPTWDWSRPAMGTTIPVDDRPWLAAHGDGVVYYLVNGGAPVPGVENLLDGSVNAGSKWLYVSRDAGETWTLGHALGQDDWCQLAASPADDATSMVVCQVGSPSNGQTTVRISRDRGQTFPDANAFELEHGPVFMVPGAAFDRDGTPYVAWLDDYVVNVGFQDEEWQGDQPGRVEYAVQGADGAWTRHDVTPFPARFGAMHASAGSAGVLALVFYATDDLTPGPDSKWYAYAMMSHNASSANPAWSAARIMQEPAVIGDRPPVDFFQGAVGTDDVLNVVVQKDRDLDVERDGAVTNGPPADVYFVRQAAAPSHE